MPIGYPPSSPPQSNGEITTTLLALSTNQTFASNRGRISGFILNFSNRQASLVFGTVAAVSGAANTTPLKAAASNLPGSIDLPDDYDGPIQIIWAGGTGITGSAVLHEMI
jgi:hypothetical protein